MSSWQKMYDLACSSVDEGSQFVTYLGEIKELLDAVDGARSRAIGHGAGVMLTHDDWDQVLRAWQHSC